MLQFHSALIKEFAILICKFYCIGKKRLIKRHRILAIRRLLRVIMMNIINNYCENDSWNDSDNDVNNYCENDGWNDSDNDIYDD